MVNNIIRSDEWIIQLLHKLDIDYTKVNHVIIEAKAGEPVYMYIGYYGDTRLLDVKAPTVEDVCLQSPPS